MLHGLLFILKIIGIILLVIIGLLIFIILSVLLVPIRYKGKLSYCERPAGLLKVTWLLHILSLRLQYENELTMVIRVFGIPVIRKTLLGGDEEEESEEESEAGGHSAPKDAETIDPKSERKPDAGLLEADSLESDSLAPKEADSKKKRFARPRFKSILQKIKFRFQNIGDKLKQISEKKDEFFAFWNDEENQKTFRLMIKLCRRLLKHIFPGKLKGRIAFGFDDPYKTGQVLMYASPFLGWYHKKLSLEPYFDRVILEGEIHVRGRIRIGTVLLLGYQLYRDRNFRKLWRRFRD